MNGTVCPQCGGLVEQRSPGKAVFCPRCMFTVEMPAASDSGEFWSDSLSDWESSIADAPRELAVALGNGRLAREPDALRTAIYGLFGLVAFLIALIGTVLVARELRPLVQRSRPVPAGVEEAVHQLEVAEGNEARREAARNLVGMGPNAVIAALDRSTSAGDGAMLSISQPIAHALVEVGPEAVNALSEALGSPKANVRAGAANVLIENGDAGQGGEAGPRQNAG